MKNVEIIKQSILFKGIEHHNLDSILACLSARVNLYKQGEFVFHAGGSVSFVGIVISGKAVEIKEDEEGNRIIISEIMPGGLFAEAYACAGAVQSDISVQAATESKIMILDYKKVITVCSTACVFHTKLIENMLEILANKVLMMNHKLEIVSKRTIREKLMSFFERQKSMANSNKFAIPFNREQLADFLFVDRSALSRELSRMQDEGLIKYKKNMFEIY
jgi:CRP-like cAMP-binding protein